MVRIWGRNLRARARGAAQTARRTAQEQALRTLTRSIPGPDALGGKLRPSLLLALTPMAASTGSPTYLFSTRDRGVGWTTYRRSSFDEHKTTWVVNRIGGVPSGSTVVDIGANIGTVAIPLVTRHGAARIVAFEPEPLNFKLLRCNVLLNDAEERITCIQVAVSKERGSVELELSQDNYGDHRVRARDAAVPDSMGESARATISVPAKPLQEALAQASVRAEDIGLVWVDTQGHEGHVLAGAGDLPGKAPWVMEYWPYGLRRAQGLDLFHKFVTEYFSQVIDIKLSIAEGRDVALDARDVAKLADRLTTPRSHTDLLLLA
jgi:FkbM family methyltransferase